MRVFLHVTNERGYLFNESYSMISLPEFVTSPDLMILLKDRYDEKTMNNIDLLLTITNEDLQQLVDNALLKWRRAPDYLKNEIGIVISTATVKKEF
ncbi:hypothetical protein [Lysinibacillus sp. 54212]|uniref:hypothetical protein n=1 Tax=Lysinibacillus sp. 54212 TaxID=3119829 RepID=UPI002FC93B6A